MQDSFKTLNGESIGEFRDRGSKFIGYATPIGSGKDVTAHLEKYKKEHPKARHWCYAYRLGIEQKNYRANDDGEPSGTAGRPILGQIDSFELTDVLVVVVRYFGGTKLGTSGLKNAYKISAREALSNNEIVEKIISKTFTLFFDYAIMGNLMNAIKKLDLESISKKFDANPQITIEIKISEIEKTLTRLKAEIASIPLEQAAETEAIEGLIIEEID